jgi:hypothetical protein
VIKFGSDLRQVGGFLWVLQFPPAEKMIVNMMDYAIFERNKNNMAL